ncbi:hypothetical protein RvY_16488 [Ramazzottius varieornatus]|uniref:Uncharacterized protein n=1 Tax=Ramazzottius varieornatus TaxID=947166 RepID=A0A1D1VZY4_RAMVA|nr:hypothetical protein RvY_16488 [Ramazzottius varieornatus]
MHGCCSEEDIKLSTKKMLMAAGKYQPSVLVKQCEFCSSSYNVDLMVYAGETPNALPLLKEGALRWQYLRKNSTKLKDRGLIIAKLSEACSSKLVRGWWKKLCDSCFRNFVCDIYYSNYE